MTRKKVSVSGIDVFAECPRKYRFQYVDRKFRPSNQHFIFGTSGHTILEYISNGFDDDVIYTFVEQEVERRSMQEALTALKITDLKALTKNYIKVYREFLSNYKVVDTEVLLEDKDNKGVIDLIAIDIKKRKLIIIDNKFSGMVKTEDDILDNLQLYMYAKLLEKYPKIKAILKQYNIKHIYLGYFTLSKIEIGSPRVLVSGKLSKAVDKRVTYDSFLKAITDNGLAKADYQDHLDKLARYSKSSVRYVEIKLVRSDMEEKLYEISSWTKLINHAVKNNLFPGRNAFHCTKGGFMGKKCDIYKECKNSL